MNTMKGIARVTAKSPKALASFVTGLFSASFGVLTVVRSHMALDDCLLIGLVVFFVLLAYLQFDWMLWLVESPEVVWRIPVRSLRAALTIDDVPLLAKPTVFEEILDVLKKHEVTATLFIMSGFDLPESQGGMAPKDRERCRALLKRAVEEGHELGNHLQFDRPAIAMESEDFDKAFLHCDALIAELSGGRDEWQRRPCRWFRPASAMWNKHMLSMAEKHGYRTVISNCFPHDVSSASRFFNAEYLARRVRAGAVVCVHDRWHTPATLDSALPRILAKGIKLCSASKLQQVADAEGNAKTLPSKGKGH